MGASLTEDHYAKLVNEEDAWVCREIPEAACRETPRNSFLLILLLSLLGLAGAIVSWLLPETT
jgi:hypothetical protein